MEIQRCVYYPENDGAREECESSQSPGSFCYPTTTTTTASYCFFGQIGLHKLLSKCLINPF
jgi:hypothetical protein